MKIIITENQNVLLRRYEQIKDEVYNRLHESEPCYYRDYHNYDTYKRDVLKAAIDHIIKKDKLEIDSRLWTNFRNGLMYEFTYIIEYHYNNYIKEHCPD
jgi:hypothetical protein